MYICINVLIISILPYATLKGGIYAVDWKAYIQINRKVSHAEGCDGASRLNKDDGKLILWGKRSR